MLSQVTPPPPAPPSIPTAISTTPSETSHCNEPSVNANAYYEGSNLESEPHTEDESRGNEYVDGVKMCRCVGPADNHVPQNVSVTM